MKTTVVRRWTGRDVGSVGKWVGQGEVGVYGFCTGVVGRGERTTRISGFCIVLSSSGAGRGKFVKFLSRSGSGSSSASRVNDEVVGDKIY